jgi:hypothetical protein
MSSPSLCMRFTTSSHQELPAAAKELKFPSPINCTPMQSDRLICRDHQYHPVSSSIISTLQPSFACSAGLVLDLPCKGCIILSCMEIIGPISRPFQPFLHMQPRSPNNSSHNAILPTSLKYKRFQHSQLRQKHQMQAGDIAEVQQEKGDRRRIHSNDPSQAISKHGKLPSHPAPGAVLASGFCIAMSRFFCQQKTSSQASQTS